MDTLILPTQMDRYVKSFYQMVCQLDGLTYLFTERDFTNDRQPEVII